MGTSILTSIKQVLGIVDDDAFDVDVTMHINSAFSTLSQLGAAPPSGFIITDESTEWEDLLEDRKQIELVKSYVYVYVRLLFDPPTTSFALNSMEKQKQEFEWRLNAQELLYNPHAYDRPVKVIDECDVFAD